MITRNKCSPGVVKDNENKKIGLRTGKYIQKKICSGKNFNKFQILLIGIICVFACNALCHFLTWRNVEDRVKFLFFLFIYSGFSLLVTIYDFGSKGGAFFSGVNGDKMGPLKVTRILGRKICGNFFGKKLLHILPKILVGGHFVTIYTRKKSSTFGSEIISFP
jgi:hypothetical protein